MDLYLLRHATAVEIGAPNVARDADRYLSKEGVAEMEEAAKGIRRMADDFEVILTSPFPRARQTADIVAKELGLAKTVKAVARLEAGASPKDIMEAAQANAGRGPVMIVGHNPELEETISACACPKGQMNANLKKGGLAVIRFDPDFRLGAGQLIALLTCKHLRMMGK